MKRFDMAYRITKIGGRAVSVAVCAMTGMMFMGSAHAADVLLGTSFFGSSGTPNDGTTQTGAIWDVADYWRPPTVATASYGAATSRAGDVFYGNQVIHSYLGGPTYILYNNYTTNTDHVDYLNDSSPYWTANAIRSSSYVANSFGAIVDASNANNYIFGAGASVSNIDRGAKAYTTVNVWGAGTGGGYINFTYIAGQAAAQNTSGNAIEIAGNASFSGDNVVDGGLVANAVVVAGSNVNFNGNVDVHNGGLLFTSAGSANLNGGADLWGSVNFQGHDATLTLSDGSTITGNVTTSSSNSNSGNLVFSGSSEVNGDIGAANARLSQIDVNGNNSKTVTLDGMNYVNLVNINSAGNLVIGNGNNTDGLDTTGVVGGRVDFNNAAGSVTLANTGTIRGTIVSTGGSNGAVATVGNVVNFAQNGTMIGNIGTSAGNRIGTVNVGSAAQGTVGMIGDLFASALNVINSSTLNITGNVTATASTLSGATGSGATLAVTAGDVTGNVVAATNGKGVLTLAGGSGATANTQVVTGNVGATGARLNTVNSGVTGSTSTFMADVSSNTINVAGGTSNFTNNVNATTTNIGTGVGNFNTNGTGLTQSNIAFADAGTANLHTGLTGTIDFNNKAATVNVWAGQTIAEATSGARAVTSTGGTNGVLNFLGAGTITGDVGASVTTGVSALNVNTAGTSTNTVVADGNIFAASINLKTSGALTLTADHSIVGTTATALTTGTPSTVTTDVANTGTLTLAGGAQSVTGVVGAKLLALGTVNAGAAAATSTFNNMVYANTLNITGNGSTVVLNGQAGLKADGTAGTNANSTNAGLVGTVDFNSKFSTLQIGDNVNLTTGAGGIQMANAENATLTFAGTSRVTGVVGGDVLGTPAGRSTLRTINAGVTGEAVTFTNDVFVSETALPTTFHVTENGTVNFNGNLHGQLVFNTGADGTVNVSDSKSLIVTTANTPAAVSIQNSKGTINFLGSTVLSADLGVTGTNLKAVNFNTATNNVTQAINKNVFADTVTIGGAAGTTAVSKADVTGVYDYAGATRMTAFAGGTTANISNVTSLPDANITLGGNLVIANATTAVNFGVAHVATGNVTTNGGAMSFTVHTTDITTGGSVSASTGSGQVTATGALNMTGAEKVQINYVGSLAQGGTYALITSTSGAAINLGNETGSKVSDNSFSIDTSVAKALNGSLIVTADRTGGTTYAANQNYIQKAGTVGDFSNNAGIVLGGIAAAGSQTGDMVQVIQKLELDSFGYGNNAANLATQVKRLAPVANAALTQSSLAASGLSLNAVGVRMSALRGDTKVASSDVVTGLSAGDEVTSNGFWFKALGSSNAQDKQGAYDGYSSKVYGLTAGIDNRVNSDFVVGAALGLTKADINQADFRTGDTTRINNTQLMGYGTYNLSPELYLDGALSYGRNAYTGVRATAVGRTALSSYNGNQLGARLGLGYGLDLGDKLKLTPMASVDFSRLNQDAYTETGAGAINLAMDAQSTSNTRLGLGARLNKEWTDGDTTYRPEVALNWYQNSNILNNDVKASFVGGGAAFVTPGTTSISRNTVNLGVALTVLSNKTSSIQIRYDLDKSTGFTANTGSLLARWEY